MRLKRFVFSVTNEQLSFLKTEARLRGINSSELLRRLIDSTIEVQATRNLASWDRSRGN